MVPLRLILIRHGETDFNRDGLIQGRGEQPLNETGLAQAAAAGRAVSREAPFVLYHSSITRAVQTARAISDASHVKAVPLEGVEELDPGEFEGLTGPEMRKRYPDVMTSWDRDPGATTMPGGESLGQVQRRAWQAVSRVARENPDQKVIVVTHNFPIQTIICQALGMPLNNFRRLSVALGSITRFELSDSTARLVSMNERWHLETERPDA
jgi:broad specificity phosphatase PhoE